MFVQYKGLELQERLKYLKPAVLPRSISLKAFDYNKLFLDASLIYQFLIETKTCPTAL